MGVQSGRTRRRTRADLGLGRESVEAAAGGFEQDRDTASGEEGEPGLRNVLVDCSPSSVVTVGSLVAKGLTTEQVCRQFAAQLHHSESAVEIRRRNGRPRWSRKSLLRVNWDPRRVGGTGEMGRRHVGGSKGCSAKRVVSWRRRRSAGRDEPSFLDTFAGSTSWFLADDGGGRAAAGREEQGQRVRQDESSEAESSHAPQSTSKLQRSGNGRVQRESGCEKSIVLSAVDSQTIRFQLQSATRDPARVPPPRRHMKPSSSPPQPS